VAAFVAAPIGIRSTVVLTSRRDGDCRPDVVSRDRLSELMSGSWTMLTEDHGTSLRCVEHPGEHDGATGDASITAVPEAVLGVWVGDCAPVAVIGDSNVAIAHAGWRGVRDGILESVFAAFRSVGDRPRSAIIGPHIKACCNEFGRDDLATMVARFGSIASSTDSCGRPSLDLRSIIQSELERADVGRVITIDACTRCRNDRYFSHRAGDPERQVMAIRIDAEVGSDDR